MREISAEIDIGAPPERVWSVLTDFSSYPDWSPFIRQISGEPAVGARLRVRIEPPGGRGMTFRPRVVVSEPSRELRWLGRLGAPGLFDGEHSLRLEPLDGARTRFVHSERFRGALVPLFGSGLIQTRHGFEAFNTALKERAEREPTVS